MRRPRSGPARIPCMCEACGRHLYGPLATGVGVETVVKCLCVLCARRRGFLSSAELFGRAPGSDSIFYGTSFGLPAPLSW